MSEFAAFFYDGKSSQRTEVQVFFHPPGELRISGLAEPRTYRLSEVRVASRVGNTPRSLYFPDGAKCETLANDTVDRIAAFEKPGVWGNLAHNLERRLVFVGLALVLMVAAVWGFIEYGIPALATHVARAVPLSVDDTLGEQTLKVLDRAVFTPSELPKERQAALRAQFEKITSGMSGADRLQLEFRAGGTIGPNAFALPSGTVVITDALVLLARHPAELTAIMAHEAGHIQERHSLRGLLQNSGTVLLISSITGDVTSIAALSGTLPAMLLEAKYSRVFESEADDFALEHLEQQRIPARHFADILERMEDALPAQGETTNYLASHPSTGERLQKFRARE